jgi:hypothetical protein
MVTYSNWDPTTSPDQFARRNRNRNTTGIHSVQGVEAARGETQTSQQRKPIEIPQELSTAAEQRNLTYSQTLELLETYNSVIARRSARQLNPFTADQ